MSPGICKVRNVSLELVDLGLGVLRNELSQDREDQKGGMHGGDMHQSRR